MDMGHEIRIIEVEAEPEGLGPIEPMEMPSGTENAPLLETPAD